MSGAAGTSTGSTGSLVGRPRPRSPVEGAPDSGGPSGGGPPATEVIARFGSFLLARRGEFEKPFSEVLDAIISGLEKDPRIRNIERPLSVDEDWCIQRIIYPGGARDDEDLVLRSDHLHALRFSMPLTLDVEVPAKNQRLIVEGDPVPTRYRVAWDGWLVVVTWRNPSIGESIPLSGGHVVRDILEDALERCGEELFVQACDPACTFDFAHTAIRAKASQGAEFTFAPGNAFAEVEATMPDEPAADWAVLLLFNIRISSEEFLEIKNLGRRILDLEKDARHTLGVLTATSYERALIPTRELRSRPKARWEMQGWRKESRKLISRLWLAISLTEGFRRQWSMAYLRFEDSIKGDGRSHLFALDYAHEVSHVRSLELDLLRAGAQEAAQRLDSRTLSSATALAGVAGATAGGIVAAIVGGGHM